MIFWYSPIKKRIYATFYYLLLYRIGIHIPIIGINQNFYGYSNLKLIDVPSFKLIDIIVTGGSFSKITIFSLGIIPLFISIIFVNLLYIFFTSFDPLTGKNAPNSNTYKKIIIWINLIISLFISSFVCNSMGNIVLPNGEQLLFEGNTIISYYYIRLITLTAGTFCIMILAFEITKRGIVNGLSLIILTNILAEIPDRIIFLIKYLFICKISLIKILFAIFIIIISISLIIIIEQGQRRIPVQFAKRVVGRRMYGGQSTHLPLKINSAGITAIRAATIYLLILSFLLYLFNMLLDFSWIEKILLLINPNKISFLILNIVFIFILCYFFTAIRFNPESIAENMKKHGGYIPGIRPGKRTADYIDRVLTRITFFGTFFLIYICILPDFFNRVLSIPISFGGITLLLVIGIIINIIAKIESLILKIRTEIVNRDDLLKLNNLMKYNENDSNIICRKLEILLSLLEEDKHNQSISEKVNDLIKKLSSYESQYLYQKYREKLMRIFNSYNSDNSISFNYKKNNFRKSILFSRFTANARKSIVNAFDEAVRLKNEKLDIHHVTLGVIKNQSDKLKTLRNIDIEELFSEIESNIHTNSNEINVLNNIYITQSARSALDNSFNIAKQSGRYQSNDWHIILSIIKIDNDMLKLLSDYGITLDLIRRLSVAEDSI